MDGRTDRVGGALDELTRSTCWSAVAEVHRDGAVVRRARGTANLATSAPARPGDAFRIGSITKTFVATALLQLVAAGELALSDRIGELLPGAGDATAPVTVRQLLNHSSGLPNFTDHLPVTPLQMRTRERLRSYPPQELLAISAAHEPDFPPGRGWKYSNTNYVLAGLIVERITGRGLAEVLRSRIVTPLGLRGTWSPGTSPFMPAPHLHGYVSLRGRTRVHVLDVTVQNPSRAWASGDLIATTRDLGHFFRSLLGASLLPAAQRRELTSTVPGTNGRHYGLGIFALPGRWETTVWGYTGAYGGYLTVALVDAKGTSSVVLCATPRSPDASDQIKRVASALMARADSDTNSRDTGAVRTRS